MSAMVFHWADRITVLLKSKLYAIQMTVYKILCELLNRLSCHSGVDSPAVSLENLLGRMWYGHPCPDSSLPARFHVVVVRLH